MLKRDHDEEKKKLEELNEEIKTLKNIHGKGFQETPQKARNLFLSIESELLLQMRKEEEGLFPIIEGNEDEMWGLSPFLIEHYELERMVKEIHETIGTLYRTEEKSEAVERLIRMLSVKIQLLSEFLSHHLEMEEKVLFQMVLEAMNTSELSYAYGMMKILESWPPSFLKR